MSDKLNEKFEEFVTEQKVIVENAADPMPTVSATVIPGTGSEPTQVSDAQTSSGSGKDPQPKVDPSAAPAGQSVTDLGGTSTAPNEDDDDGDERAKDFKNHQVGLRVSLALGSLSDPNGQPFRQSRNT